MPPPSPHDVLVLGAGAAGLVAAFRAAELGADVVLLEKNTRPGLKILISGGGRCNVTHDGDARGVAEAFGEGGAFLRPALAAFPPRAVREMFEAEGVALYVEEESGKVFPRSETARDILDALLRRLERSGARLDCGAPAMAVKRSAGGFAVETPRGTLHARRVIVTTGGRSYAKTGTTGDGYAIAAGFGHTIVPTHPALVALTSASPRVTGLAGIDLQDAEVRLLAPGATRPLARRRAPLLFTHQGLSGPAAMDVSRAVSGHPAPATLILAV
ncbi:MAG: aminoacetone oxidase family FAD-binding enzyme, partial [Candidatus Brocadiae bacterium]|nr:aminoacetone oxidase family FAD-binding enzyme [Candidatus Brocadiia bacterium]